MLGSGVSDYLDITCAPEDGDEASAAVFAWIRERRAEWRRCDFQELRGDSPLLRAGLGQAEESSVCPVLRLRATWTAQLSAVDRKLRRSLRASAKRLHQAGAVECLRAGERDCDELLGRLFELHAGRWTQRGESGMFSSEALRVFHREVAARFRRAGMLRLYGLRLTGVWIAAQYNFSAKGRVYAYLSGFDLSHARSSPGAALLAHSVEDAIGEGAREFDFLRESEAFKYAWGAEDTRNFRLLIHHAGEPSR